jgi:hypothetical protein
MNDETVLIRRIRTLALVLLLALSSGVLLAGCDDDGPVEEAGENMDEAVDETGDAVDDATD